jgi:hypothetical protein
MDADVLSNPRYVYADVLIALSSVDGVVAEEREFLNGIFENMKLDPTTVEEMWLTPRTPDVVEHLLEEIASPRFKNSLLKDCLLLAQVDGTVSPEEHRLVGRISQLLDLDDDIVEQIRVWVSTAIEQQKVAAELF